MEMNMNKPRVTLQACVILGKDKQGMYFFMLKLILLLCMFEPTIKYRRVNDPKPAEKDISECIRDLELEDAITNEGKQNPVKININNDNTTSTEAKKQDKSFEGQSKKTVEKTEPNVDGSSSSVATCKEETNNNTPKPTSNTITVGDYTFEEEENDQDTTIKIDPADKDRIIITLSTGKQYSADRYCPHAGADLATHGKVGEHDYPPEIGPVLMCPFHYWEFALDKEGSGGRGHATINACSIEQKEKCSSSDEKKKLEW